ncbi:MAG: CatB-related O-acetyltransferase [Planctomycetota bacterium]
MPDELIHHWRGRVWGGLYKRLCGRHRWNLGAVLLARIAAAEGGWYRTATARALLSEHNGVEIGAFSYGGCFRPGQFPHGTRVGRYCSIAANVRAFSENHPLDYPSLHPLFYDPMLLAKGQGRDRDERLEIGHDAWIGWQAVITPGCSRIGLGAVVAAGAVVTKDVPDFSVVAGNPARVLRYRLTDEQQQVVRESAWWELSPPELQVPAPPTGLRMDRPPEAGHPSPFANSSAVHASATPAVAAV